MNKPLTLQEYLETVSLQRKRQFFMMNEARNVPNPMDLDTQNKIDYYVKHLIGQGPLFSKFQYMIENLHKTFKRQLTELTSAAIYKKTNNDKRYLEDIKKANQQLNNYLIKCEKQTQLTGQKLEHLLAHKKQLIKQAETAKLPQNISANKIKKVNVKEDFDELDFQVPAKIQKVNQAKIGNVNLGTKYPNPTPKNPLMNQPKHQ